MTKQCGTCRHWGPDERPVGQRECVLRPWTMKTGMHMSYHRHVHSWRYFTLADDVCDDPCRWSSKPKRPKRRKK